MASPMHLIGKASALLFRVPVVGEAAVRGQSRAFAKLAFHTPFLGGKRCGRRPLSALILAGLSLLILLFPCAANAQILVTVNSISTLAGTGLEKSQFLPGEEIRYQARISVFPAPAAPLTVSLRIMGEGWYEDLQSQVSGAGPHTLTWGGAASPLYTSTHACTGKASLHLTASAGEGEQVTVNGRRHTYLTINCPAGLLAGDVIAEIPVGKQPYGMALTANGRYLYVTSEQDRIITVIDVVQNALETVIPDWEVINRLVEECRSQCPPDDDACKAKCKQDIEPLGGPTGVAPSPDGTRMLVADYRRRFIHTVNAATHELMNDIPLTGIRGVSITALAVNPNPLRNEVFVADYGDARLIRVGLAPPYPTQELRLDYDRAVGTQPNDILFHPSLRDYLFVMTAQLLILHRNNLPHYWYPIRFPTSSWSMALNPRWTDLINPKRFLYIVLSPGAPPGPFPFAPTSYVFFWDFTNSNVEPVTVRPPMTAGNCLGDMVVREDGRYAYAVDSYQGSILLLDLERKAELRGCARMLVSEHLPEPVTGRLLLKDPTRNRLYVATWEPGYLLIVE